MKMHCRNHLMLRNVQHYAHTIRQTLPHKHFHTNTLKNKQLIVTEQKQMAAHSGTELHVYLFLNGGIFKKSYINRLTAAYIFIIWRNMFLCSICTIPFLSINLRILTTILLYNKSPKLYETQPCLNQTKVANLSTFLLFQKIL